MTIVVVTSLKGVRTFLGRHWWKIIHFTTYAAAIVFFTHGIIADPQLKNRPIDFIDAEKVYVELCALAVVGATVYWTTNIGANAIDAEKVYVELCALAVVVATIYRIRYRRSVTRLARRQTPSN